MKSVKESAGKRITLAVVLILAFACLAGCTPPGYDTQARIRIDSSNIGVFTQEVEKAENSWMEPETDAAKAADPTYQIIIDGNLGAQSNWGAKESGDYGVGNGFLDKKCTTYDSMILLLSEITSGEKMFGYFSCEAGEANSISDSALANGAHRANYFSYDPEFGADSNNAKNYKAHKNIANLVSDIAATAAKHASSSDVFILVSDLAMQNESQSNQIADALAKYVIADDSLTFSLIGIQADFVGKINNVPRTSLGIEPKRIFGEPYNSSKAYQRYVYLLIVGAPEQVYDTTNQIIEKCRSNRNLSRAGQVESLFFSGLECASCTEASAGTMQSSMARQKIKLELSFCGNIAAYGAAEYPKNYAFVITDKTPQEDSDAIDEIPFAKVYSKAAAPEGENIRIACEFPFILRSSPAQSSGRAAGDGGVLYTFSKNNPAAYVLDVKALDLKENAADKFTAGIVGWDACDPKMFTQAGEPVFDAENGTFQMGFTINTSALTRDLPFILSLTIRPSFMPDRSELLASYAADWLTDWSMDMAAYNQDWDSHAFLFTQATKTAYLAETFLYNLLDRQIDKNIADATEEMDDYAKTIVFGVVTHDKDSVYTGAVDPNNPLGWAFSEDEAAGFPLK